ncbi:MAG: HAD-IIB family hydrolase [Candidatus Lokiarchaeota archaeon]|nr:HAD-IIB family hydrolase [Candidatus Lokiarchaeota archaeon]
MPKKLLISDLDGTLLDSVLQLSQNLSDKLNRLLKKGIDFTIATGRDFENTKIALYNTHIQNPIVLTNGAIMADFPSGSVIEYLTIPSETVNHIHTLAESFGLKTMVFASYDETCNYPRFIKGDWWDPHEIRRLDLTEYEKFLNEPVISIQFMNTIECLSEMYSQSLKNSEIQSHTHILFFEDAFLRGTYWLEYNPKQARKEIMVESLVRKKGYSLENTVVFGDNYNDVGMFQLVKDGTIVVVENAPDEIKKYADYIVPANTEGGVFHFIEKHIEELI